MMSAVALCFIFTSVQSFSSRIPLPLKQISYIKTFTDIQKKLYTAFLLLFSQAKSAFALKDLDIRLLRKTIMYLVHVCRSGLQITDRQQQKRS